jgi:hypothetical protein
MTDKDQSGISRRRFVRESGLLAAGATLGCAKVALFWLTELVF